MTDLTIILRSLTARLFSTVTTVATVAVAVALLLVLLSMRDAGRQAFERGTGNMHLVVSGDTSPLQAVLNGVFLADPPARAITWARYGEIAADPRLDWAIPTQLGDSYRGRPVLATTAEYFTKYQPARDGPWRFAHGRAFGKEFEVVLGARAAAATGLKLGDQIVMTHGMGLGRTRGAGGAGGAGGGAGGGEEHAHVHTGYKYTVVGVLAASGSAADEALFTDLTSTWILHAFDRHEREEHAAEAAAATAGEAAHEKEHDEAPLTAKDLTEEDRKITGIYLRAAGRPGTDASAIVPTIAYELRKSPDVTVAAPNDEIGKLFRIVGNVNQIFLAMAGVVMLSSGIGIMLALYNSMEARRRQIAVLRVLGASRGRIFALILTESAVIGLLGAAAGVAVTLLAARLVAAVMKERLGLTIDPDLGLDWPLAVSAGAVVLAAVAGLIPAAMAYRTPVARNLRPIG